MSYLVLARKWRPGGFEDLVGQEPIARILKNSISQGKIAHAYIFSGPRGVGKTSTARIFAKALNCAEGPTAEPCGRCPSCKAVAEGSSIDIIEIDGASNNGVENIRDLREKVRYAPSSGRYKIYIIDEAHMLSDSAFNAFLKTLEEPPAHVVFVMATTDPKDIPLTVFSRCQHLPFKRISTSTIKERLRKITVSEGLNITPQALELIARAADGSMRDSLTLLDQIASVSSDIEEDLVKELLGLTEFGALAELTRSVLLADRAGILDAVSGFVEKGADLRQLLKDLIKIARDLLVLKYVKKPDDILDASEGEISALKDLSDAAGEEQLLVLLSELLKAEPELKYSFMPRVALEMALLKVSYLRLLQPVKEAIEKLESAGLIEQDIRPEAEEDAPRKQTKTERPATEVKEKTLPKEEVTSALADKPEPEPWTAGMVSDPQKLLQAIAERINKPGISSVLRNSKASIAEGVLRIETGPDGKLYEDDLDENRKIIEKEAFALYGKPLKFSYSITSGAAGGKSKGELIQEAARDPFIKEALDLFDGKITEIKEVE